MLLIQTRLAPSPIHGIGLFTLSPIARAAKVWVFDSRVDKYIPGATFAKLPIHTQAYIRVYGCLVDEATWELSGDDARFINHAADGNTWCRAPGDDTVIALRDIGADEELTGDYARFCFDFQRNGMNLLTPRSMHECVK